MVNPHDYGVQGNISAEGQAFVIQLHAAYREWVQAGSKGANGNAAVSVRMADQRLKVLFVVGVVLGLVGVVV